MATAVIIGNGLFPRKEYPRYLIQTADLRVCCDGALKTFLRYGFPLPDAVVGDMDSLPDTYRKRYADIIFPESEQEDNDQTKAIRWITRNRPDIDTIHILGATGRREDHTIGNLSLLMEYERTYHLPSFRTGNPGRYRIGHLHRVRHHRQLRTACRGGAGHFYFLP